MSGMPPGFAELLARKYAILQQEADAGTARANAAANLDTVRAGLMPAESKANIGLTQAQTKLNYSNAANVDETTKFVGPLARSTIGLQASQAMQNRSQAGLLDSETAGNKNLLGLRLPSAEQSALDFILKQRFKFSD